MSIPVRVLAAAAVAALIVAVTPLHAQEYENDVRLRIGGYFPVDLPTTEGTIWGFEVRNFMNPRDGIAYSIHLFDEQRTEFRVLNVAGTPTTFTFRAKVKIQPLLLSWFRVWPKNKVTLFAGAGAGFYLIDAFSGGFSKQAGFQIRDFGDFRFLEDATLVGVHVYGGIDLFPDNRWGVSFEGRFHLVEDNYSATELSTAGIFRF